MTGKLNLDSLNSRTKGFALAELLLSMMIAASLFASIAFYLDAQRQDRAAREYGRWMAQYVNGVAAWMASRSEAPTACGGSGGGNLTDCTGTDWLKSVDCVGGNSGQNLTGTGEPTTALSYLACTIPNDFNNVYGIGQPSVTFDWTTNDDAPTAEITFGTVKVKGSKDVKMAATLASEINAHLENAGYIHANAFIMNPSLAGVSELTDANLRATIDTSIEATVFVRRDGNTVMTGPLVTTHNNWALIGRDEGASEFTESKNKIASANLNDIFIRSAGKDTDGDGSPDTPDGMWASEVSQMAIDAFAMAARSPQYMSEVSDFNNALIPMPTCATSYLTPQIHTYPIRFIGGDSTNAQLIAGVRTWASTASPGNWKVHMEILDEAGASWHTPPAGFFRIGVVTRCN